MPDVTVVGAGPNGLAAAVIMARAGLSVDLHEQEATLGGGARTKELTLPGFRHDVGAAVHPMSFASRFFREFELEKRVAFEVPSVSYVHPFPDGSAGVAFRDLDRTVENLGADGSAWRSLLGPLVERIDAVSELSGNHLLHPSRDLATTFALGLRVLEQAAPTWNLRFRERMAPAMLTGVMAHAIGPVPSIPTSAVGLVLAAHAHARGWPVPVGGSQAIVDALERDFRAHGGRVLTGSRIIDSRSIRSSKARIFDVSARALAEIASAELPAGYARRLRRFRYGDGIAKVDFALNAPVPWLNVEARRTPTLHLGGTRDQIQAAERRVKRGGYPANPYVLVTQPSVVDPTRAPAGHHVLWAYIHVPSGSAIDPTEMVTHAIEQYAPGFRDTIEATARMSASQVEGFDPNFIGGDISAGALTAWQLVSRPVLSMYPWRIPVRGIYLGSSSTPPATGVHGMSGFHAARLALRDVFGLNLPSLGLFNRQTATIERSVD